MLVWPVGLLTGDDDDTSSADSAEPAAQTAGGQNQQAAATASRRASRSWSSRTARSSCSSRPRGLAPSGQNEGYYVWLYNSQGDAKSLGGQVTDQQGNYQAIGACRPTTRTTSSIDVTRQRDRQRRERQALGRVGPARPDAEAAQGQQQGKKPAALGQTVLQPPS